MTEQRAPERGETRMLSAEEIGESESGSCAHPVNAVDVAWQRYSRTRKSQRDCFQAMRAAFVQGWTDGHAQGIAEATR